MRAFNSLYRGAPNWPFGAKQRKYILVSYVYHIVSEVISSISSNFYAQSATHFNIEHFAK